MSEKQVYGIVYLTSFIRFGVIKKRYVGQTTIKHSYLDDSYLGSGVWITRAIKKYGKKCFFRETLEECYSKEELNQAEEKWIKRFNAVADKNFFNLSKGGDNVANPPSTPVYRYAMSGEFLAKHESIIDAACFAGVGRTSIKAGCKQLNKPVVGGYQWSLEYKEYLMPKDTTDNKIKREDGVECYDLEGNYVKRFVSQGEAGRFIGDKSNGNINKCCKGIIFQTGGYQWRYVGHKDKIISYAESKSARGLVRPVQQIDPIYNDVVAVFPNSTNAAKSLGILQSNIWRALKFNYKVKGFYWRYAD